jgi:hypothetical protein
MSTDRRVILRIAVCALGFRAVSAVLALLVNVTFPLAAAQQFQVFASGPSPFWDALARYDTGYFEKIAWEGYKPVAGGRSNLAYFPVYPMLIRLAGSLFGRHHAIYYMCAVGVAWACFVLAMIALYSLARLDLRPAAAQRAVLLTAIFPFAFFFGVAYSESTFLLFTVLAFYLFRTRRWLLGGMCGGLATATRVPGIFMLPALAWVGWTSSEPTPRDRMMAALAVLLAASGFGAYCVYVWAITGNPLEWAASLERWGYHPGGAPWTAPAALVTHLVTHPYRYLAGDAMAPYDTLYGVTGLAFLVATPFVWRRFGAGYGLFMLLNLLLPLSSGVFEGVGRYCSVLFPCFIWLATIRSETVATCLTVLFALFYTLGLALFTTIHPLF